MPQVRIIAKNFMDMVAALPAMKLDKLYENAFICEAILRSLPPLAKKYVLQMLCIEVPVTAKSMEEWVLPDGVSKHRVAIDRLIQLRIFTETVDRKRETTYTLNPIFQTNLKKLLLYGVVLPRDPMPSNVTVRLPSSEDLEAFALGQWECFLLQLINSSQIERPSNISSSMMKIFQRGLLSQRDKEAPRLTESGFQFLLMDTNAQLWYIIREYISNSEERGVDSADLISFLLELSFHVTGEAYNINTLTEVQKNTIKDLADLGLVKLQQGRKDSWFIPTRLATNLSVSLTDSSSRKQIISFLQQNAHPRVAERVPSVPENVTDQIRLWETDLNRVEMTPAYHYDGFPSRDLFEGASDFARGYNALLWEDPEDSKKMSLVVKAENHVHMREYLSRQRQ
ncbi:general transcription and DNA repair factor IIH subunit TFB2 isoform X3 [Prunus dulcis]|uniref:general transcription and DNA repair factor IIH subunit TFB2 isoform X3 n=1 Tax=Prunus dulcis TaxID=3755 RepID=UPI0014839D61|nr:general transcription and DNA repair factor IIH subunit TFB2 isoform X3 [Prunus dulcis]